MTARIHRINIGAKCQVYYSAFITVLLFIFVFSSFFCFLRTFYENKRRNRFVELFSLLYFFFLLRTLLLHFRLQLQNEAFSFFACYTRELSVRRTVFFFIIRKHAICVAVDASRRVEWGGEGEVRWSESLLTLYTRHTPTPTHHTCLRLQFSSSVFTVYYRRFDCRAFQI